MVRIFIIGAIFRYTHGPLMGEISREDKLSTPCLKLSNTIDTPTSFQLF
jgi:hypothetical protein